MVRGGAVKTGVKIIVGCVVTVALWLGAPAASFVLSRNVSEPAKVGAAGDIFGASSALFAGLGFFGLVVVLLFDLDARKGDLKDRMESRKPFIVPTMPANCEVTHATTDGTHTSVVLRLDVDV